MSAPGDDTVLVTGASGFLGAMLVRRLAGAGRRVVGLDAAPAPPGTAAPHVEVDVRDAEKVHAAVAAHRPRRIVHAGAISGPMVLPDDPRQVFEINVLGTLNVLEAARAHQAARVVFLSSFVAYGDQPDERPVAEDRPLGATDAYGASKAAGEAMARAYRANHGVETVSLRLGAVYGPGRTTRCFVRTVLEDAIAGRETRLDFGAGWHRSYVHADDVADAIERAADAPSEHLTRHAYNVGGGVWPTLDEVVQAVRECVPTARATLAAGRVPFDYRIGPLDLAAAGSDLGYRPQVALADGIARYRDWLAARARAGAT